MSDFQSLIDELAQIAAEPLAKAQALDADADAEDALLKAKPDADDAQDDAEIKAAADGDRDDDGEPDGEDVNDEYDDDEADDGKDEDETLGKSFAVEINGQTVEAYDGAALIKSLRRELRTNQAQTEARLAEAAEALRQSTALIKSLHTANAALSARVERLATSGAGRKSSLSVHDKRVAGEVETTPAAGAEPRQLMAKALDAQRAGRLTGGDVATLDLYLGRGLTPPDSLLAKIA